MKKIFITITKFLLFILAGLGAIVLFKNIGFWPEGETARMVMAGLFMAIALILDKIYNS